MYKVLIALALLFSNALFGGAAYAAGYTKPAGVPTLVLPSHGVEVGVWAAQTPLGHGIGVFERSLNGTVWTLCNSCLPSAETSTLDGPVNAAGGPGPYILMKVELLNQVLARRYPAIGSEPLGTMLDKVNGAFGSYAIRFVNGAPQLGPR